MAVKEGKIPKEYSGTVVTIYNNGYVVPYTGGLKVNVDRRRTRMGLPELIPPDLEEIRYIIEETGLGDLAKQEQGD
jgi:hypothetical protein